MHYVDWKKPEEWNMHMSALSLGHWLHRSEFDHHTPRASQLYSAKGMSLFNYLHLFKERCLSYPFSWSGSTNNCF